MIAWLAENWQTLLKWTIGIAGAGCMAVDIWISWRRHVAQEASE